MRILYHHHTLADGAEGIHITQMVGAFRSLGHEVHVRALPGRSDASARLVQRLKAVSPQAVFEAATAASNIAEYWRMRHSIRALRPDFLYKRHARLDVGALHAARDEGIPTVLEVNCLFTSPHYLRFEPVVLRALSNRLERQALKLADIVVAVSTPLARQIAETAAVTSIVLPNGVDAQHFDPRRVTPERVRMRYRLGNAVTIGWVGVIREWHGLELLLPVLTTLPDVTLLIVGDGPTRSSVQERIIALGLDSRTVMTGRIAYADMPSHVAAMDIAVVADDGTRVASPMKLVEYMAMARAVIAPRLENIADLVTDGVDGLLFEPRDSRAIADAVRRLAYDPDLRLRLGQAARQTVERSRTWHSNAERILTLVTSHTQAHHAPREQYV